MSLLRCYLARLTMRLFLIKKSKAKSRINIFNNSWNIIAKNVNVTSNYEPGHEVHDPGLGERGDEISSINHNAIMWTIFESTRSRLCACQ